MSEKNNSYPTHEQVAELNNSVDSLTQEVQVLRNVLDEIREDLSWALRNQQLEQTEEDIESNDVGEETKEIEEEKEEEKEEEEEEVAKVNPEDNEEFSTDEIVEEMDNADAEHAEWIRTIRDPAYENSEGIRKLEASNGKANAEYEVSPLPDDRWAIRISLTYWCGNCEGNHSGWIVHDSREDCIDDFENRAKQFFHKPVRDGNETQLTARREMLLHFENSLFGFQEPAVIEEGDLNADEASENNESETLQTLKHRILDYLAPFGRAINLQDIRFDLGFADADSINPLSSILNRALAELRDAGNVSVTETDFGDPDFLFQRPLFLRSDRQTDFDGMPYYNWNEAEEDRDTLTVDRVGGNGDGGEHRFTVKRGDTVEAFFSRDKQEVGKVVGISHSKREVRVSFREGSEGTWFAIGSIYPAIESIDQEETTPLSEIIEKVNQQNGLDDQEWTEADRIASSNGETADVLVRDPHSRDVESLTDNHRLYQFDEFQSFLERRDSGDLSAEELQNDFLRLQESSERLITELIKGKNATELKTLASRFGCLNARQNNKQQNAEAVIRSMSLTFTLKNSVTYQPFSGETYEDAIAKVVAAITDEDIQQYMIEQNEQEQKVEKSLHNPETMAEFRYFVERRGEDLLSHEQLIQYDKLRAEQTRLQRANQKPATVEQFNGDVEGLQITIKEGYHTKKEIPLWICQLNERIDRATFTELKIKAKQLGGWWSSFKKADAGFQFKSEESAQKFQSLLQGDADRSDELTERKELKIESASERLSLLADDLEESANASLHQDRQTNTVRRSEMAAGIRGRAYVDIAFAGTLRSLSGDLASGEAIYLDGIRTKTQLQTLIDTLRRAKRNHNEKLLKEKGELGVWDRHRAIEDLSNRPMDIVDAEFAEYPYPTVYKRNLEDVIHRASGRKGIIQRSKKMQKRIASAGDFIQFKHDYEIKEFSEFCTFCKDAGIDVQWIASSLDDYKRLQAANIHTLPELRMALRELVPHLQKKREDDPVLKAEQALVGKKLDGFFPTPKPIISRMIELANIEEGQSILEPSAGKGDILDMLRLNHPGNELTAIEMNSTLFDVLEAKGHDVERGDFLEHEGSYDRIVMNPPFEKGADITHVRHAFDQLAEGGRLIAIMGEGAFFRSDTQASEFRTWLEDNSGESEQLPEDAFNNAEAFRKTGVRTRIVTIEK